MCIFRIPDGAGAGDWDGDCLENAEDLCPAWPQTDLGQLDSNGDGTPDECQCGDANGDGFIGEADAAFIELCVSSSALCDPTLADTDNDGDVDLDDADNIRTLIPSQLVCLRRP